MRPVDADELVMFPYSEGSGTEEQIAEWIEQAGLSEHDTADRARELCWRVIEGCVNVVKTQPTLTPQNEWIDPAVELPPDDDMVLAIVSGKPADNITLEDAYELASYGAEDGWIVEQYELWETPRVSWWRPLPDPPEKKED